MPNDHSSSDDLDRRPARAVWITLAIVIGALVAAMFVILATLVISDLIPGSRLPTGVGIGLGLGATAAIGAIIVVASRLSVRWLGTEEPDDFDPTFCRTCGYNLTGNVSGVCSECGRPIEEAGD